MPAATPRLYDDLAYLWPLLSPPEDYAAEAVAVIAGRWSGPVFAYPHRGVFEMPNWRFTDTVDPSDFADAAVAWIMAGARIVGGCCGIGPAHIRELSETLPARLKGVC